MVFDFISDVFITLFDTLNRQDNHIVIVAVYLCITAAVIFLRVIAKVRFSAALVAFRQDAKELKTRDDVKKIRNTLLRRTVATYKSVADKAVTRVPATQLIERQIDGLRFVGWRYSSLVVFVEGFESGLLWVGLIFAVVFNEFAHIYGVLAVAVFLLLRLTAAAFDFRAARTRLCDEMLIYIEREVGRFYASDSGGAVLRLKDELAEAQNRQTTALTSALTHLTGVLTENTIALGKTITETTKNINTQIAEAIKDKLVDMNTTFKATLEGWEKALAEAGKVQTAMNGSAEGISKAGARLQSGADLLSAHMQGHSAALSDQMVQFVRAMESVKDSVEIFKAQQEILTRQALYIEQNQETLETALAAYEASLQGLTQNLGDGLGAFINLHAQGAAQAVNDALRSNLDKIMQLSQRGDGS
jgi:hypothetical protein